MKPGSKDKRVSLLIAGDELTELKRLTWLMSESFGLDTRIENYHGKRPIGLYSWDFECLLAVIDYALKDELLAKLSARVGIPCQDNNSR